jgi:predicted permease
LVALGTGIVAGLLPAIQASRPDLASALKSGAREGGGQRATTRSALLVVQAALSVVLLVGAGLFVRSLLALNATRMGVDPHRVLTASMNLRAIGRTAEQSDEVYDQALARVLALPGMEHATIAATTPFGASWGTNVQVPGRDSLPEAQGPFYNAVGPGYFATLGTRILDGREFTEADSRSSQRVVVINATMARLVWPGRRAVGECIRIAVDSLPCATVVGVVEDIRRQGIFEGDTYFVHVPLTQDVLALHARHVLARPRSEPRAMLEPVRRAIQTAAPGLPYAKVQRIGDLSDLVTQLRPWRLAATLFAAFGVLALVLAAVGLYGVVSYSVAQRMREMGVRVALGAQRRHIAELVLRQGAGVTGLGVALGIIGALFGAKFATPLLYETSPRDPVIFGVVVVTLFAVALVASAVPALRATRADPIDALRSE